MAKLVVTKGPTAGLEYPIRGDVLIGRDPRAQIIVAQREVSAQHARLSQIGDRFFIEDLGSRNGTWLNSHPIQRHPLDEGDEITIGRTVMRFERGVMPPATERTSTDLAALTIDLDATRDIFAITTRPSTSGTERQTEQVLKLLCDVSRTIGAIRGLKATLDEIANTLFQVFPQCGRVMVLLTRDGTSLEPVVTRWRGEQDIPATSYSETVVNRALKERRAILTVDALSDDRFSSSQSVMDLRLRSLMCVPLLHREQVLGVVELDSIRHNHMFKEDDLNLLTAIVAQVAFAVANARAYEELQGVSEITVASLTTALRLRSPVALAHAERVSRYAQMLGRKLDLSPSVSEHLRLACLLHDIGLLGQPGGQDEGHFTPTRWTPLGPEAQTEAIAGPTGIMGETPASPQTGTPVGPPSTTASPEAPASTAGLNAHKEIRRQHLQRAEEILLPIRYLQPVIQIIRAQYEWYDGTYGVEGLKGSVIPLEARILAVADLFDALTARESPLRCSPEQAFIRLRQHANTRLDPQLLTLFEQLWGARMRLEARRGTS